MRVVNSLRETAGKLINGDVEDGAVETAMLSEAADLIESLEGTIDKADKHTAFLMDSIKSLETRLKAAEYAAKVNYDGWQQEMARKSRVAGQSTRS